MAEDHKGRTVWAFIGKGVGLVAAVFAIASVGWYAAIEYHDFRGQMNAVFASARVADMSLQVDELAKQLKDEKAGSDKLREALASAARQPSNVEWQIANYQFLRLYGAFIEARVKLTKLSHWGMPSNNHPYYKRADVDAISNEMAGIQGNINGILVGARLMRVANENGKQWVSMTKYPFCKLDWNTGKLTELQQK